jgi:hypothetical protein
MNIDYKFYITPPLWEKGLDSGILIFNVPVFLPYSSLNLLAYKDVSLLSLVLQVWIDLALSKK